VASLVRALGMRVLLNDPPRERREGAKEFVSLETLIGESDIVTFHVPLNPDGPDKTLQMVDEKLLTRFGKRHILINSSRGEVLSGDALKPVLKNKSIQDSVLDVWEHEPEIDRELLGLIGIGTPHIAGYSADGKANGTAMSVQSFSQFFGLDLAEWYPERVPLPASTMLEVDCAGQSTQSVLATLVRRTYDLLTDDARLRISPGAFEKQRGEYPLRREFPTYTARLLNAPELLESVVAAIGFKILH